MSDSIGSFLFGGAIWFGLCVFGFFVLCVVNIALRSPFKCPHAFRHVFDVTGMRLPDVDDLIDRWLIDGGFDEVRRHMRLVDAYKADCERRIGRSLLKNYRRRQYSVFLANGCAFRFVMERNRMKYRQSNYVRISYDASVLVSEVVYDYDWLLDRYQRLEDIGFECTLKEYEAGNQRRLMTCALREAVMRRDNYTCQICGKHMPDEVGLQIDHIVPVSKGGKSVMSNLQVLCSKCNGRKSDKL